MHSRFVQVFRFPLCAGMILTWWCCFPGVRGLQAATFKIPGSRPNWVFETTIDPEPTLSASSDWSSGGVVLAVGNDPITLTVHATFAQAVEDGVTTLSVGTPSETGITWTKVGDATYSATLYPGAYADSVQVLGMANYSGTNTTDWAQLSLYVHAKNELSILMSGVSRSTIEYTLARPDGLNAVNKPLNHYVNGGIITVKEPGVFRIAPETMTTGPREYDLFRQDGTAEAGITAPLSSEVDEDGYVSDLVTLAASDGLRSSEEVFDVRLPFALVERTRQYVILHSREEVLMEPRRVSEGELMRPGDVMEVFGMGGEDGDLILRFCDGHQARITSYWGMRLQLGQSQGVDTERSSVRFWLSNTAFDVSTNPRHYGKIIISKAIGHAVANAVLPGSGLARYIVRKGLSEGTTYTIQQTGGPQNSPPYVAEGASAAAPANPFVPEPGYVALDIYSDGSLRLQSGDGSFQVSTSAGTTTVPAGASVMADLAAPQPEVSGLAANELGSLSTDLAWSLPSPSTITNRTPNLKLSYDLFNQGLVRPGTLDCRIDGVSALDHLIVEDNQAELRVPASMALTAGSHLLEAAFTCLSGQRSSAVLDLTVNGSALPGPPEGLQATSFGEDACLIWRPAGDHDLVGYHVYRSDNETGPFTRLTSSPHPVAAWLDTTVAVTTRWYAVETVCAGPLTSPLCPAVSPAPEPVAATMDQAPVVAWEGLTSGIRIRVDSSLAHLKPCRLERAGSSSGPWTPLLGGTSCGASGLLDATAVPEQDYWYRAVLLESDLSELKGPATGPARRRHALADLPRGLTAWLEGDQANLRWDPSANPALGGYLVYRDDGAGFVQQTPSPIPEPTFTDPVNPKGSRRWRVVPVSTSGQPGPGQAEVGLAWWAPAGPVGEFVCTPAEAGATEAGGTVRIGIERLNGDHEAAFVTYATSPNTAEADVDYTSMGGTLVFEDGETKKYIDIPLLSDAETEPTEQFSIGITSVGGGALWGWPYSTLVSIFNGAVMPAPEVAGSTLLTAVCGQPFYFFLYAFNFPRLWVADTPPVWCDLDPATGVLTGTPDTPGIFDLPVTLSNYAASTTVTFRIEVTGSPVLDWTAQQVGSLRWLGAHYADGRFLLVGENGAMSESPDGRQWTPRTSGTTASLNAVTYYNGRWVAAGDAGLLLSAAATTSWTPYNTGYPYPMTGVTGGNNLYVAVGYERTILSSPNGLSWTVRKSGGFNPLGGVTFGASQFVAAAGLAWGYPTAYYSTDAVTWGAVDAGGDGGSGFDGITYGGDRYVAVGASGRIFSSTDGLLWTKETTDTTGDLHDIAYGGGLFIAVGDSGIILCSPDGQTWSPSQYYGGERLDAAAFGNGCFVLAGESGTVLTAALRLDRDGDGMSDEQETLADTDPLDRKDLLRMDVPHVAGSPGGCLVRWKSSAQRTYAVYYTDDVRQPFQLLRASVGGQAGFTEWLDTSVGATSHRFYRVTVNP